MKRLSAVGIFILLLSLFLAACSSAPPPSPGQNPGAGPQNPPANSPANTSSNSSPASSANTTTGTSVTSGNINIKAEVWADNWFAFYLGEQLVKEDSVSITTERSFNAEIFTFNADYPMVLNFIVKDFKENDTGLEYIGTNRQQMGDGGFIAQFTDASTGQLLAATDAQWNCLVIQEAPLDKACERTANPVAGQAPCEFTALDEPANWKSANFDASAWDHATVYTAAQVDPKDGYQQISWNSAAQLIWGPDLETNNTLLCRLVVSGPQ